MNRRSFLKAMATLPLMSAAFKASERMPVLFLGHGSPMNAILENEFVQGFRHVAARIPRPKAILCVSAHWETDGTWVTAMPQPRTIHDFGGFPKALFDVQYPAPGDPRLATQTQELLEPTRVGLDHHWGLDHGAWSVIKHLYPKADIPVLQLSLDRRLGAEGHYALGRQLADLRDRGVLIVGSGNMVHNLGKVNWARLDEIYAEDWAMEASDRMKSCILDGDHQTLLQYTKQGKAFEYAIPTPEHYLPLLYTLALQRPGEQIQLFNDRPVAGALTMTSVQIGM